MPGGYWRLLCSPSAYVKARTTGGIIDRIHRDCRAIDAVANFEPKLINNGQLGS